MTRSGQKFTAIALVGALALVGCRSDSDDGATTTAPAPSSSAAPTTPDTDPPESSVAPTTPETTPETPPESTPGTDTVPAGWTADISACPDQAAVTAPIEGEIFIGAAQPLSGSPAAIAFSPVKDGFEAYIDYANANNLLDGVTLTVDIRDDQYDPAQTPGIVDGLIDDGADVFAAIIGSPNNLAVRDTLNEECIPQLLNLTGSPDWGDVASYPWTTGALVTYDIEVGIYAKKIKELLGDGATVGMLSVNSEFGSVFSNAFKAAAAAEGLEIVSEQSIEPADETPPANQVAALSAANPQAIVAVPLGAQCPRFLGEVVKAKAVNTAWDPQIFLTNTCASRLLIDVLAQGTGDGVYSSTNLLDPADPKNAGSPALAAFEAQYAANALTTDKGVALTGWSTGEALVKILVAAQSTGTLSRQTIIEAARNLTYTPSVTRPGADYRMNGEADAFPFQSLNVQQWDGATKTWTDIGPLDTSLEL